MAISKFLTSGFKPALSIPQSCIEGAEYIIQSIKLGDYALSWAEGTTRKPHVLAVFGGNVQFNISNDPDIQNDSRCSTLTDYSFGSGPDIGQGIILLNKTKKNKSFNMHLGAVVAVEGGKIYMSNVAESGTVVMVKNWDVLAISKAEDFRTSNGFSDKSFAIGLLKPEY